MSKYRNGLIAVMESADNEEVTGGNEEILETAAEVAEGSVELNEESDDIDAVAADVEDAAAASDELEEVGAVAQDAVDSGEGLDETAAEMASIAIESIRNRIGIRGEARIVPVAESFGNSNSRLVSTRIVTEGVVDTIKRIWQSIKAAALRVWDAIRGFFAKLFNSTEQLDKLLQSLKERVKKMPAGVSPKEKTIKSGVAKVISVKKKANLATFKQVSANVGLFAERALTLSALTEDLATEAKNLADSTGMKTSDLEKYAKNTSNIGSQVAQIFNGFDTTIDSALPKAKVEGYKKGKDKKVSVYGPFLNSQALIVIEETKKLVGQTVVKHSYVFDTAADNAATELTALNVSEVMDVITASEKILDTVKGLKRMMDIFKKITDDAASTTDMVIKQAAKTIEKGEDNDAKSAIKELQSDVTTSISTMNKLGNMAPRMIYACAKAGADYASVCIRNLGEKK